MDNRRLSRVWCALQLCKRPSDTDFRRNEVELERQTLSIMKACEVVGVSRRTIYNWMAGGKIEFVRTAGGSVRIFADSLWRNPEQSTVNSHQSAVDSRRSTVESHGQHEIKH